jgi:hypothetical protein
MDDCNICFELKDLCTYYACVHKFCENCCKTWNQNTCPLCRKYKKQNLNLVFDGETDINLLPEIHKNIYLDIFRMLNENNPDIHFIGYKYYDNIIDNKNNYFRFKFRIPYLLQREEYIRHTIHRYNDNRNDHKIDFTTYELLNDNLILGFRKL